MSNDLIKQTLHFNEYGEKYTEKDRMMSNQKLVGVSEVDPGHQIPEIGTIYLLVPGKER
jgi:hypothetical protein